MSLITYKWTISQFHRAIESGIFEDRAIELLRGNLIIMTPESESHAYYNAETGDYLRTLLGDRVKIRDAKPITLPKDSYEFRLISSQSTCGECGEEGG